MSQEFSFKLEFEDFDVSLLGTERPAVWSDEFKSLIADFFVQQFAGFGGNARVIMDDEHRVVEVRWTQDKTWKDPQQKAIDLLNSGHFKQALSILTTLFHKDPTDVETLYRLGLAYSELGQYQPAIEFLEKAVQRAPENVHATVGLGVAEIAAGNLLIAEAWLKRAIHLDPNNRWALSNLVRAMMKRRRFEESLPFIGRCLSVAPDEIAMMIAYGDGLIETGRSSEADAHYRAAIETGGPEHLIDLAKARLTEKSEKPFRNSGDVHPDAVEYIKDALKRFQSMDVTQLRSLSFELAMIGNRGLNINDPKRKHQLQTWPGDYTGLQLISFTYAAFQQFAPSTDVGIDLSREYQIATQRRQ